MWQVGIDSSAERTSLKLVRKYDVGRSHLQHIMLKGFNAKMYMSSPFFFTSLFLLAAQSADRSASAQELCSREELDRFQNRYREC